MFTGGGNEVETALDTWRPLSTAMHDPVRLPVRRACRLTYSAAFSLTGRLRSGMPIASMKSL